MIEFSWVHLGFLMLAGFVGSFIDAIVGGGGLITLPAWMATGLPMAYALGSNKMASVVGAITSFTTFMRSGRVDRRMLRYMPLSVIGSVLGAHRLLIKNSVTLLIVLENYVINLF